MTKIDFRLLNKFGISLNIKKKYFLIFDPQMWTINGVYDNLEDAIIEGYNDTVESYLGCCLKTSKEMCPYVNVMNQEYVGENYCYKKGFFQNLSMWDVLRTLCREVKNDKYCENIEDSMEFVLSRIHYKVFDYPEHAITRWMKI
jgi:ribosome modulation factor